MTLKPVWTETTTVKPYETDFKGLWKPHCFFQVFQQAATNHAEHLGVGYHALLDKGVAWLLARLKLKVYRLPALEETLTIQTWPRGLQQKIFFMRDFYLLDSHEQKVAAATSAWMVVNVEQRSIVKPDPAMLKWLPANPGRLALEERIDKITVPDDLQELFTVQARFSTIDLIGHVNNTRYIEWAADCFSMGDYREKELDSIQINYASEVKPDEWVSMQVSRQNDKTFVIAGSNLTSGARAFEVVWSWK